MGKQDTTSNQGMHRCEFDFSLYIAITCGESSIYKCYSRILALTCSAFKIITNKWFQKLIYTAVLLHSALTFFEPPSYPP